MKDWKSSYKGREDRISHLVVFLESLEKFTSNEVDNPLLESLIRLVGNYAKPDQFWNDEPGRQYIGSEVGASELVHGLIRSLSTSLEGRCDRCSGQTPGGQDPIPLARRAVAGAGCTTGDPPRRQLSPPPRHRAGLPDLEQRRPGQLCRPSRLWLWTTCASFPCRSGAGMPTLGASTWNLDSHRQPVGPRPEGPCRDDLLLALRPRLPEGGRRSA